MNWTSYFAALGLAFLAYLAGFFCDADGAGMAAVAGLAGARANGSSRSEQAPRRGRLTPL